MKRYGVPCLAFINKLDRPGGNAEKVTSQLRQKLRHNAALIQLPIGIEDKMQGVVDLVAMEAVTHDGPQGYARTNRR
jgi:elongation factor G